MYIIYIYIIEKYTWKIPVAAIHMEGKQYLQGHAGTKYVANGFPEHGVGFTVRSHSLIFLAINVLGTEPKHHMVIEINLTELLKQSNVIPPPKKNVLVANDFCPLPRWHLSTGTACRDDASEVWSQVTCYDGQKAINEGTTSPHQKCVYIYIFIYIYTFYIYIYIDIDTHTHIVSNCTIICIFFNIYNCGFIPICN